MLEIFLRIETSSLRDEKPKYLELSSINTLNIFENRNRTYTTSKINSHINILLTVCQ